ncbi:hypothetical protein [Nitrosopumilus sp.]|uniref:hypothetical protein n=1 Tax=Nitrosopumilus sp. TaxID=2024843 RepID=UPI00260EF2B4|nr:hypothetical protein [Nitrosopumilus sp.]
MSDRCKGCGKKLIDSSMTYCSDACLFEIVSEAESLSEIPISFRIDEEPWV